MALGDNFMWCPDKLITGETTDIYFNTLGAFEVLSFNFGMTPGGGDVSTGQGDGDGGDEGGGSGGSPGAKKGASPINAGVMRGVKLGGSILSKKGGSGGGGGGLTGGLGSSSSGGKTGAKGKPKFGTLTVNKFVDEASVDLYRYCSTGDPIATLNLAIRKSGGDPLLYLQYCFRYNQVTGVGWGGGEGDKRPQEQFTLEFKAMGMQYIGQTARGGANVAPKVWLWSEETEEGNNTLTVGGDPAPDPAFLAPIVGSPGGNL